MSSSRFLRQRFGSLLPALGLLAATSCTLRETRQEVTPSVEPQFTVRAVEQASLGTLDVLPLRTPADVDLPRRNELIEGYVNKDLPLKMRLRLNAYNPNLEAVAVTGLDYTVLVDNKVLGAGRMPLALELPSRDSVRLPLSFELNTYKLLGDDAMPALRNFALGFGDLHRQRVTLRLRPLVRNGRGRLSSLIKRPPLPVVASREKAPPARSTADAPVKPLPHGVQPL
ncbi:LEA type 2 family protein [Hymenobacter psoromatis]|uniref:LEA type 2 family protein n=1 Tax=Hymenobacter psoromatis TaxID=1484116 RepID=UPI001CBB9A96|nr:LEA type 2 family protein [Hymenobacter psoromatis]